MQTIALIVKGSSASVIMCPSRKATNLGFWQVVKRVIDARLEEVDLSQDHLVVELLELC